MNMKLVNWDDEWESGIEMIDEQHKQFIKAANRFYIKCQFQQNEEAVREELAFLEQYLLYHFQAEEAFQLESQYPSFREHQAIHDAIKIEVKRLSLVLPQQNFSKESVDEFCRFITKWVVKHVSVEDKAFSVYIKKKRAQS